MSRVKGSKHYPMKVVPHRPVHDALWRAGILVGLLGLAAAGHYWSLYLSDQSYPALSQRYDATQAELQQAQAELTDLRQQLANATVGAQVDRQSSEAIRQEIAGYKQQLSQQQEQISFYRSLMAPTDGKEGLAIGDLDYTATGQPNQYQFRLKMLQLANKDENAEFEGGWHYKLVGKLNGEWRNYELKDLVTGFDPAQLKLKFKYFQTLNGLVTLPQGFVPEYTELEAKAEGRGLSVNKRFKWATTSALASQIIE